jgi:hypothetical protein
MLKEKALRIVRRHAGLRLTWQHQPGENGPPMITLTDGSLLLEERRATGRFVGGWSYTEFTRVPDDASRPAVVH